MGQAKIVWHQVTRDGADVRTYIRPIGKDKPIVILQQLMPNEDLWEATAMSKTEESSIISEESLETVQSVAEAYVRKNVEQQHFVKANAHWRDKEPTERQVAAAQKWRMPNIAQYETCGELSNALDVHIALKLERGFNGKKRF